MRESDKPKKEEKGKDVRKKDKDKDKLKKGRKMIKMTDGDSI